MGTGWRRAFCTSIPRDTETPASPDKQSRHRQTRQPLSPSLTPSNQSHNHGSCAKFGVFSSGGSGGIPSSIRLRCRTAATSSESSPALLSPALDDVMSGVLHVKTTNFTEPETPPPLQKAAGLKSSPRQLLTCSNPASPRSPSRFALLKASLRLSRSRCGICSQSVRAGQKTAVFTAECSHSFHFPCISDHVRSQTAKTRSKLDCLTCPVCSASWRDVPMLSSAYSQPAPQTFNSKIYDDDEPLQISSAGQGSLHLFNPIPESELEAEVDGGNGYARNRSERESCGVEVTVMPEVAFVSADGNHQSYVVLLKVKAPTLPQRSMSKVAASVLDPTCRAPMDLVTVLDVRVSMTAAKLQMLKRAMRLLISSLGAADRLSIVAFSAGAKRLLPLVRMSRQGQRSARQIVDRLIVCDGASGGDCRCIGHALRKATKVLEDRRERNPVATIMLLSDSPQERQGLREDEVAEMEAGHHLHLTPIPSSSSTEAVATRFAHLEIPVGGSSEISAGGVSHQVEDVFSKCVSGLVSVVLQDVHLRVTFPSGSVSAIYSYGGAGGGGDGCAGSVTSQVEGKIISVNLGDFYASEKRELLVELRLPPATLSQQHRQCLNLSYKCSYRDPTSRELVLCRDRSIALPPLRQILPPAAAPDSACVLRDLFITTRALVESRRLVELNDLETAANLLSKARSLLLQSNTPSSQHHHKFITSIDQRLSELHRRRRHQHQLPLSSSTTPRSEQLTPMSAWRAAEQLAKVAILRKSLGRVGDLHGFENARF